MSSSLPDGVVLARPQPTDAERVLETLSAFDVAFLGESEWSLAELQSDWRESDLERDVWMALDGERVVGYLALSQRTADWEFDGYVHPDRFGEGIGGALVELGEAEARARGSRVTRTGVFGSDEAAQRVLASRGFHEVRYFLQMRLTLTEPPAPAAWPDGLHETRIDLDENLEAVHAALDDAFSGHWNTTPVEHDKWVEHQRERGRLDPARWIVIRDGEEIAGVTLLDRERFGVGWVAAVGVREPWRRRGLGEAMLQESFRRLWDEGQRVIGLGVDAQNATGATRLYERVGMHVHSGATIFEKALA